MRGAIVLLAKLASAASANAAPLRVTLTATGDAASYTWDLGDGTTASGPDVTHTYAAGRFVAAVAATGSTRDPSVPAHPASHGCLRVPLWIAPSLFDAHGFGTTVSIHA